MPKKEAEADTQSVVTRIVVVLVLLFVVLGFRLWGMNYLSEKYLGKKIFKTDSLAEVFLSMIDITLLVVLILSMLKPTVIVSITKEAKEAVGLKVD